MSLLIPPHPGPLLDTASSAIRAVPRAAGLSLPLAARVNWLLAARKGSFFRQSYPSTISALSDGEIWFRRSGNCDRLLVLALFEQSPGGAGVFTVIPDSGASVSADYLDTAAGTRWGDPDWGSWWGVVPLITNGVQSLWVEWSDLIVRHLMVAEIPRSELDPAPDDAVALRAESYAGLEYDRMITDGLSGGVPDVLDRITDARDATDRHLGGLLLPDASAWAATSVGAWGNLMDAALNTVDGGWLHRARQVRSSDTVVTYQLKFRARVTGTGTANLRFRAASGDSATVALGGAWGWTTDTLDLDATADDTVYVEAETSDATTVAELAQAYLFE